MSNLRLAFRLALLGLFSVLAACSDSGGGTSPTRVTSPPPSPPPTNTGPTWTSGVYEPASNFKDRCEVVRTGVDFEGNPFPDIAGSTDHENFWLRSWTHETYLWNDEVVDRDPRNYNDRLVYFDLLRTTQTTLSGAPRDQFHFSQPTEDYLRQRNSAPGASYGAEFIIMAASPPRDVKVGYTEPGSPAAAIVNGRTALIRGDKILEADGVDVVSGGTQSELNIINAALFPASAGETHDFLVEEIGTGTRRMVTLTAEDLAPSPVNRIETISTPTGDVGYILLNTFSPFATEQDLADAVSSLKAAGVSDLILDLRYNGGGLLAIASQLGYMIAGDTRTSGKTFELLQFNADAGNLNPVTGEVNQPVPFFNTGLGFSLADGTPLETLDLPRVFILSTDGTCSASESVVNALRGADVEVILIGNTTCGKPYGFYPTDNCGETYYTIQFRGVNDKGFGDYADGFTPTNSGQAFAVQVPGCAIADDFRGELGDASETLAAAALQYRENGTCPTPTVSSTSPTSLVAAASKPAAGADLAIVKPAKTIFDGNRDMRMPEDGR